MLRQSDLPSKASFRINKSGNGFHVSAMDIMNFVSGSSSTARLKKYKSENKDHGMVMGPMCHRLQTDGSIEEIKHPKDGQLVLNVENLHSFVSWLLHHSKKSQSKIQRVLDSFKMTSEVHESKFSAMPQEDILSFLEQILPKPYKLYRELKIGQYRVDGYIPRARLVLECDEHDHAGYDSCSEADRESFLKDILECTIIRFDPYELEMTEIVRKVMGELLNMHGMACANLSDNSDTDDDDDEDEEDDEEDAASDDN